MACEGKTQAKEGETHPCVNGTTRSENLYIEDLNLPIVL